MMLLTELIQSILLLNRQCNQLVPRIPACCVINAQELPSECLPLISQYSGGANIDSDTMEAAKRSTGLLPRLVKKSNSFAFLIALLLTKLLLHVKMGDEGSDHVTLST